MWLTDPKQMCRRHLMGEHVELHMLAGTLRRKKSIQGYINKHLVEPTEIVNRHQQLAEEITRRGYNHKSPLTHDEVPLGRWQQYIDVIDNGDSERELRRRCKNCFENS